MENVCYRLSMSSISFHSFHRALSVKHEPSHPQKRSVSYRCMAEGKLDTEALGRCRRNPDVI